jgi:predicted esterase
VGRLRGSKNGSGDQFHGIAYFGGRALPNPSAGVMAYTAHSDLSVNEPSTFMAVGAQDGIAPSPTMERRVATLRQASAEVEYRKYPNLGHGF